MDQSAYETTVMTVESILDQIRDLQDVPLDQIRARIRALGVFLHIPSNGQSSSMRRIIYTRLIRAEQSKSKFQR
jgi:hypothetical protein